MQEELDQRRRAGQRITLIGALVDSLLSAAKIIVGILANSAALIADGLHSLSDVLTDFMVVFLLKFSHEKPDANHPWGHARFETVGTVVLGAILMLVGALMAYESLKLLFGTDVPPLPAWPALIVAGVSILSKEILYHYTHRVGKALNSNLIIANAWHHRTDSLSSIVVFVAIAGAMTGVWWLDALAAVLVALLVGKIGWDLVAKSISELVDTALPAERVKKLREAALSVDGVISVHSFKSRSMGSQSLLEMHLQVGPHLSSAEGHFIGDSVTCLLRDRFDDIGHIIYHIDTYDDHDMSEETCPVMPPRSEIQQHLDASISRILGDTADYELIIYYEPRCIDLDIKFSSDIHQLLSNTGIEAHELEAQLAEELKGLNWFRQINIWLAPEFRI
ncbi:cation diffusion facilitator family transporter [Nitrincola alkalilacustris]|uniref:cation diffusion facilitator family transporter n=1 Tax=Nitrincola alkalilacustris TaxID=1571224 RepID=UPI00124BEE3B|nr:cation diffusion facilitator family transporter [Nitrincola alkalilacustris]